MRHCISSLRLPASQDRHSLLYQIFSGEGGKAEKKTQYLQAVFKNVVRSYKKSLDHFLNFENMYAIYDSHLFYLFVFIL